MNQLSIRNQIRKNLIALLSLSIAVSALAYNTWRNEESERNRNTRAAGFEIIRETALLQSYIDHVTFVNNDRANQALVEGWTRINLIRSLSNFMQQPVSRKVDELFQFWKLNSQYLQNKPAINSQLTNLINDLIDLVNEELKALE